MKLLCLPFSCWTVTLSAHKRHMYMHQASMVEGICQMGPCPQYSNNGWGYMP